MATYTFAGHLVDADSGKLIPGLRVECWAISGGAPYYVGGAVVDATGAYSLSFEDTVLESSLTEPDFFFRVYDGSTLVDDTADLPLVEIGADTYVVPISVEIPPEIGEMPSYDPPDPAHTYIVRGVVEVTAGEPADLVVTATETVESVPVVRAVTRTDAKGRFAFPYVVVGEEEWRDDEDPLATFDFTVAHPGAGPFWTDEDVEVEVNVDVVLDTDEAVPEVEAVGSSESLTHISGALSFVADLGSHGGDTLRDFRRNGLADTEPELADFRPLAELDAIGVEPEVAYEIGRIGLGTLDDVAAAPLELIASATGVTETDAAAIREAALLYTATRDAHLTDGLAALGSGYTSPVTGVLPGDGMDIPAGLAGVPDLDGGCLAVPGPVAYLTALTELAARTFTVSGVPATPADLAGALSLPFDAVSTACEALSEEVLEARLVAERLVAHAAGGAADVALGYYPKAAAYPALLAALGTSYEELAAAPALPTAAKRRLAGRLGLPGPARLAAYTLSVDERDAETLSDLFGLQPLDGTAANPAPELLGDRQYHLRRQWLAQDWGSSRRERVQFASNGESELSAPGPPPPPVPVEDRPFAFIDPNLMDSGDILPRTAAGANPAYALLFDRQGDQATFRNTLNLNLPSGSTDQGGLHDFLESLIGIPDIDAIEVDSWADFFTAYAAGNLPEQFLAALDLSAFDVAVLAQAWAATDDDEFEGVVRDRTLSVLMTIWSRQQTPTWRGEEKTAGITLSPDYFRLRTDDETPPSPEDPFLLQQRRTWERTLEGRIDRLRGVEETLRAVVAEAERAALRVPLTPLGPIGTWLLEAAFASLDADERVEAARARLFLDPETAPTVVTTRVAHATSTLQALFRAVHAQEALPVGIGLTVALGLPAFDAEWAWLSTYDTWRAALSVALYPENTAAPHLRRTRTEAYGALVDALEDRMAGRPEDFEFAVAGYEAYVNEVGKLSLGAACLAYEADPTALGSGYATALEGYRRRLFSFATSWANGALYWSAVDAQVAEDAVGLAAAPVPPPAHPWQRVPDAPDNAHIVGAAVFETQNAAKRYVCLLLQEAKKPQLQLFRYDLDQHAWVYDAEEKTHRVLLDAPTDFTSANIVLMPPAIGAATPSYLFAPTPVPTSTGKTDEGGPPSEEPLEIPQRILPATIFTTARTLRILYQRPLSPVAMQVYELDPLTLRLVPNGSSFDLPITAGSPGVPNGQGGTVVGAGYATMKDTQAAYYVVRLQDYTQQTTNRRVEVELLFWAKGAPTTPSMERKVVASMDTRRDVGVVAVPNLNSSGGVDSLKVTVFVNTGMGNGPGSGTGIGAYTYNLYWQNGGPGVGATGVRLVSDGTVLNLPEHPSTLALEATSTLPQAHEVHPESTERLFTLPGFATPGYFAAAIDVAESAPTSVVKTTMRLVPRYRAAWRAPVTRPERESRQNEIGQAFREPLVDATVLYLEEAYLAAPLLAAVHLRRVRRYDEAVKWLRAVYDDTAVANARYIYTPLAADAGAVPPPKGLPVLNDPLDPVSRMREVRGATLRHVLSVLGRVFLDGADAEFARDTPEAVDLARARYERAEAVLAHPVLGGAREQSEEALEVLEAFMRGSVAESTPELMPAYAGFRARIRALPTVEARAAAAAAVVPELEATGNALHIRMRAAALALVTAAEPTVPATLGELFTARKTVLAAARRAVETVGVVADRLEAVGRRVALTASAPGGGAAPDRVRVAAAPPIGFTIPPNPVVHSLRLRTTVGLEKIRHGLNASGIERPLHLRETTLFIGSATGTAVRFQPTSYRAAVVLERARQQAVLAQQAEAAFLSALERYDAEAYAALQARQQLNLTLAGVRLQDLRVVEATDGERLAAGQIERSAFQQRHFSGLIARGVSETEQASLNATTSALAFLRNANRSLNDASGMALGAAAVSIAGSLLGIAKPASLNPFSLLSSGLSLGAQQAQARAERYANQAQQQTTLSGQLAAQASYERRAEEWGFQSGLAQQDVALGRLGLTLARDRTAIVRMERNIAVLQANHAAETVAFLATKFTSAELYLWMSGVLEDIFVFYLQLATGTARLALDQLAFERQVAAPPLIAADYYEAPGGNGEDRRGITGSARLQADLARLDQYAFETERRKLQLVRTVSLAQHDPIAFARFRETGVLPFALPMETFDREFPGHYLRLVRSASVTVVGLIPPVQGIRASLVSSGMSTVVVEEDGVFRPVRVRRDPDEVALSSPYAATGVFQLEAEGQLRLLPFEGGGVDARWEFRLPRPANPFDFGSLADVLVSVEYSALRSDVYETEVIERLDPVVRADRPFSLRDDFADAWYDLLNPPEGSGGGADAFTVTFTTRREDFPPHLTELRIEHVLLYAVRAPGEEATELWVEGLTVNPGVTASPTGMVTAFEGSETVQGLLSTRRSGLWEATDVPTANGGALTWSLTIDEGTLEHLAEERVEDILLVLVFEGVTPPWPL